MGCWAIRTNAIDDPFETNSIYRQRDIIEKGFNQLKNEVGGSRLEATESAYRGKLFIYTLAQSLRMNMLVTAREAQRANKDLKVPGGVLEQAHRSVGEYSGPKAPLDRYVCNGSGGEEAPGPARASSH